jgi:hypothetical protein
MLYRSYSIIFYNMVQLLLFYYMRKHQYQAYRTGQGSDGVGEEFFVIKMGE